MEEKDLVENSTVINDVRLSYDFKGITFSGYKKCDVKKHFLLNIYNGKLEPSCYWCAELLCSGAFMDIWEVLLLYLGKYIHIGNPKLAIYLQKRFQIFRNIMSQGMFYDELELRNHKTIRHLFGEIICVFTHAVKKAGFESLKINKEDEFDLTKMTERLKADSAQYTKEVLRKKDPNEIMVALNEFMYHINPNESHNVNMMEACYWLEWVIEFDAVFKKRKQECKCDRRYDVPVEPKFQCEIIWIIWDAIFHTIKNANNEFVITVIQSIFELFCIKFTISCTKKRRFLLYFAISMICEPFQCNQEIIHDKNLITHTLHQLPNIYKQIKKNEVRPKTDYLFSGIEDVESIEKSKQKMEWMNAVDIFSPNSDIVNDL